MTTAYHARYFAHDLTRQTQEANVARLSASLFDSKVDLNPHQVEAALFALRSPLSKGAILADEVGLGKTIEAGLVLCQLWAEGKRRLLVVCPASIRKQWSLELEDKFHLPSTILDAKTFKEQRTRGNPSPFEQKGVVIVSMHYASRMRNDIRRISWDMAVIDEAHKLRNAYRPSNRMGQALRWALEGKFKLLLTATPLQNSLLELYGLSSFLDEHLFGEPATFRSLFMNQDGNLQDLRERLAPICKRTLRKDVLEYIRYTERRPIALRFRPSDEEHALYTAISDFLRRDQAHSLPSSQRQLVSLILRKLLASSSHALAGTLQTMRERLLRLKQGLVTDADMVTGLVEDEEMETDLLEEMAEEDTGLMDAAAVDVVALDQEIAELDTYIAQALSINVDAKSTTLLTALETGFASMLEMGAQQKALIFTESRKTQDYLYAYLESNGYAGKVVAFNGANSSPEARNLYESWLERNRDTGRSTGSRIIDARTALIEHFQNHAQIMIATEAAAEGVNLQFCSLVINYDLPWNPQRIEQRIGRCHRYGQKHDVVVINFLNERNEADSRVFELLTEKFQLFDGVFGASDEVLGAIESGVDFEKRILEIYQSCRTTEEIDQAFALLRRELDSQISLRMSWAKRQLLEVFDQDVHDRLRVRLDETRRRLDAMSRRFWTLTRYILSNIAVFEDPDYAFELLYSPREGLKPGRYRLVSKEKQPHAGEQLYRLSHPLGEYVLEQGKTCNAPEAVVTFHSSSHPAIISLARALEGRRGWLHLQKLQIDSFQVEEHLLFSGFTEDGETLDQETCEKLFLCNASPDRPSPLPEKARRRLRQEAERHAAATVSKALERNIRFFEEEREKLDKWAEDMILSAERELQDTKNQIKLLTRQARQAETTEEQHKLQKKTQELQRKQRRQRQQIFDVEDEIIEKRDALIIRLEKRMAQKTQTEDIFTIEWRVV